MKLAALAALPLLAFQQPSAPGLGTELEALRVEARLPALGAALVTRDGLQGLWVSGTRRAGGTEKVEAGDLWHLGSCTKAMTATMIALLVERGELSLDRTLAQYFPELGDDLDEDFRELTLVELMSHRAGLAGNSPWFGEAEFHDPELTPTEVRERIAVLLLTEGPALTPKKSFQYANDGFILAGHIAERATKKSWEELMRTLLFKPLGMTSAGFGAPGTSERCDQPRGHGEDGKPVEPGPGADNPPALGPAGTVHATLADWAKFAQLHLKGAVGDVQVGKLTLHKATFERLQRAPYTDPAGGLGWVRESREWAGGDGTMLWHNGSNTMWYCLVRLAPARGFATLVTTNRYGPAARNAAEKASDLVLAEFERRAQPAPKR